MSEPIKPPYHDQQSPTAYAIPGYVVPSAFDPSINQPNRWINWVLINILSFIVAIVTFAVLLFIAITTIGKLGDLLMPILFNINTFRVQVLGLLILGLIAAITGAVSSLIQRSALNYQVPRWQWVIKTALAVGMLFPISTVLSNLVGDSFFLGDDSWQRYIITMMVNFGPTAFGTALVQAFEVKKIADDPTQWVWVSGFTWTILGSLVVGSIISFFMGVIGSISV